MFHRGPADLPTDGSFADDLRTMIRRTFTSYVRPEAQEGYNAKIQRVMGRTVWNSGGCSSWYIDRNGRNTTIWPDFTWRFRLKLRRFDASAYAARVRVAQSQPQPEPAPA